MPKLISRLTSRAKSTGPTKRTATIGRGMTKFESDVFGASGYVQMKCEDKSNSKWKKRLLVVKDHAVYATKVQNIKPLSETDLELEMLTPLNICTIKLKELKMEFSILTPYKIIKIRTSTKEEMNKWISFIQQSIEGAHQKRSISKCCLSTTSADALDEEISSINEQKKFFPAVAKEELETAINYPGNELCADCGISGPQWASISYGVTLCIGCSGIHRGLGVSFSRVRSLDMDRWSTDILMVFLLLGNLITNSIYADGVEEDLLQRVRCGEISRLEFITDKYINKKYLLPFEKTSLLNVEHPNIHKFSSSSCKRDTNFSYLLTRSNISDTSKILSTDTPEKLLIKKTCEGNLSLMQLSLAHGANINYQTFCGKTPLIYAANSGQPAALIFLLIRNADPNIADDLGNTALHYAASQGNPFTSCVLLKFKANFQFKNKENKTPLEIAQEKVHVDVIVALKLADLQEKMSSDNVEGDVINWAIQDFDPNASQGNI